VRLVAEQLDREGGLRRVLVVERGKAHRAAHIIWKTNIFRSFRRFIIRSDQKAAAAAQLG
jgi:hypothetical protein